MSTKTTSPQTITSLDAMRLAKGRIADAWSRLASAFRDGLSRQALNRRIIARLSHLSERDLADIGLTPSDLRDAALSENGDATQFLVARRDAHRATWRGQRPF